MRVTGGSLGGRRLAAAPGGVRPSADRVREALFARLPDLEEGADWSVLDIYAGTGALGIEALSRGAGRAVFVERSRAALAVLRRNVDALGLGSRTRVLALDARAAARRLAAEGERFQLVLADPPYADRGWAEALSALVSAGLLDREAVVVVERSRRHPLPDIPGLRTRDSRRYGDTVLEWLEPEWTGPEGSPDAQHQGERQA